MKSRLIFKWGFNKTINPLKRADKLAKGTYKDQYCKRFVKRLKRDRNMLFTLLTAGTDCRNSHAERARQTQRDDTQDHKRKQMEQRCDVASDHDEYKDDMQVAGPELLGFSCRPPGSNRFEKLNYYQNLPTLYVVPKLIKRFKNAPHLRVGCVVNCHQKLIIILYLR